MKGGMVVRIRLPPKDCLGVLDLLDSAGIPTEGKSFNQCASLALGSLIALARQQGIIPRDEPGFAYLDRMLPFQAVTSGRSTKAKQQVAESLYRRALATSGEPPQALATILGPDDRPDEGVGLDQLSSAKVERPKTPEDREALTKLMQELQELMERQDRGESLTPEELRRYAVLNKALF